MPDILLASIALVRRSQTAAGERAYSKLPRAPSWPLVLLEHDGSRQTVDTHVEEARIVTTCEGRNDFDARRLAYQIRDVFLPPPQQVEGFHGDVSYFEPDGTERECHFGGVVLESGPRPAPDAANRIITAYLVQYW